MDRLSERITATQKIYDGKLIGLRVETVMLPNGERAPNNAALVEAVAKGAAAIGRPLGTAAELRRL